MTAARPWIAITVLAGAAFVLVACGEDAPEPAASVSPAPAAVPSSTAPAQVASTAVTIVAGAADEDCAMERNILATSVEVYVDRNGALPASEADLVEAGIIGEESEAYDLVTGTGEVVRVPGVPCPDTASEPSSAASLTVDDVLAEMGEDGIAFIGGPECAREFAEIALAGERFIAREGRDPGSLDELAGDLAIEPELWTYDDEAETLTPSDGSPCIDVFSESDASACDAERATLEVAVEAYTAQYGEPPASEDDLVPDFLRQPIERYDLGADASVVLSPGSPCEAVAAPTTTSP